MQALRSAKLLVSAINAEDISEARQLLLDGSNPNLIIPDGGVSAFHLAVGIESEKALEFVKVILQYGGDPNVRSTDGMTPVLIAAAYGRYQALCLLLERGGDPTLQDETGSDAMAYAVENDSWDCIALLKNPWRGEENATDSHLLQESSNDTLESSQDSIEEEIDIVVVKDKVVSESYLCSRQGFDVTSPDNPIWFFKGSLGTTVVECSGLDQTVVFRGNTRDSSNSNSPILGASSAETSLEESCSRSTSCASLEKSSSTVATTSFVTCSDSIDGKSPSFNDDLSLMTSDMSSMTSDMSSLMGDTFDTDSYIVRRLPSANNSLTSCYSLSSSCTSSYSQLANETSESFLHHDKVADTVLIEKQCPSASPYGVLDSSMEESTTEDSTIIYDWHSYHSIQNPPPLRAPSNISSDLLRLTDNEIRQQLEDFGYSVGPITETTKRCYLRRLKTLKEDPSAVAALDTKETKGFRFELAKYINGTLNLPPTMANLEQEMVHQFQQPERDWREGKLKSSFNYLLLDPRVSNNLPLRYTQMTEMDIFTVFINAVFYVGKGKRNRPYSHFNEALHFLKAETEKPPGAKVKHILDIWEEGHGVVSLHCFQNVIPVEAYTREACMVQTLGIHRLTNVMKGNFYGEATSWSPPKQRTMGVYLLKKACQIFLVEGERQIRPGDIVIGQ